MKLFLWFAPTLLCACVYAPRAPATSDNAAFTLAYALFVGPPGGQCTFWLTDTGMVDPADVTESLSRNGYDLKRGIEVLHEVDERPECISIAREAATKAGFLNVRSRLATEKDRFHGVP